VYIAAGDVRKRLSQQLTAPRKTRFNKDPDDPSGIIQVKNLPYENLSFVISLIIFHRNISRL
jgi:hypothetical protein